MCSKFPNGVVTFSNGVEPSNKVWNVSKVQCVPTMEETTAITARMKQHKSNIIGI